MFANIKYEIGLVAEAEFVGAEVDSENRSIEVTVRGGDDLEVAMAIFRSKYVGIGTTGNTSMIVEHHDHPFTIRFERP